MASPILYNYKKNPFPVILSRANDPFIISQSFYWLQTGYFGHGNWPYITSG